jgi:CRISPR-associated protein Cmr5
MNSTTRIKGIEQGRAEYAYKCALQGKEMSQDDKYKAYVKRIPMLIKTNGLGPTFAFVKSKGEKRMGYPKNAYDLIYEQTKEWLKKDEKGLLNLNDADDLVEKIISLDSATYRAVTSEVLSFLVWLKRFADGLIEGEAHNE